ncbi:hypothetical protein MIR68_007731 [Amoeboaphelidium protococcarum]|nr:hypothetical protein MIR68_007731 [Amoeboaphelidium protococcarum]
MIQFGRFSSLTTRSVVSTQRTLFRCLGQMQIQSLSTRGYGAYCLPSLCNVDMTRIEGFQIGDRPQALQAKITSSISSDLKVDSENSLIIPSIVEKVSTTITRDSNWTEFWKLLRSEWLLVGGVVLTAIVTATVNVWIPVQIGGIVSLIQQFLRQGQVAAVLWKQFLIDVRYPVLKLFSLFAAQGVLTFGYIALVSMLGERLASRLKASLYQSLISMDISTFDSVPVQQFIQILQQDVQDFKHAFKLLISQGLKNSIQLTANIVKLWTISYSLSTQVFALLGSGWLILSFYGSYLRRLGRKCKDEEARSVTVANEALSNIRTVRSFANEEFEMQKYADSLNSVQLYNELLGLNIGVFQGIIHFGIGFVVLSVLHNGGVAVVADEMTAGDLMSYLLSIQDAQKTLNSLSLLLAQSMKASGCFQSIVETIQNQPTIPIRGGKVLQDIQGSIEFQDVSFHYPSRPDSQVLRNFNLSVRPGEIVGICGQSGIGKSTISALVERFYDSTDGQVLIDGQSIQDIDPLSLRQSMGYINQEPSLFSGTILDNVRYGDQNASIDDVKDACKQANAHDFIMSFPDKYETIVGERGVALSGGQKQRIAIARALIKHPRVLILDEATSALDSTSEHIVQKALDHVMNGKTVLIVAHRLSTLRKADRIIVMGKGGVILESGSFEELLSKRGEFYKMYSQQHSQDSQEQ